MGFSYKAVTEEEAQKSKEFPLLPDGIYDFIVIESKFKTSRAGNPMIELKLRVTHDGLEHTVFDNLIPTDRMIWKVRHFCAATGNLEKFEKETFNENDAMGSRGMMLVGNVGERPKDDGSGGVWKAKNVVDDYLTEEMIKQAEAKAGADGFVADAADPAELEADIPQ